MGEGGGNRYVEQVCSLEASGGHGHWQTRSLTQRGRGTSRAHLGVCKSLYNLLEPLRDQGKVFEAGGIQEGCLEEVVFGEFGHQEA